MSSADQSVPPPPEPVSATARRAALFIAPALLLAPDAPGVAFLLRMNRAAVVLLSWSQDAVDALAARGVAARLLSVTTPAPSPKAFLGALRQETLDAQQSWLVTDRPEPIAAAATAGLGGVVLVGAPGPDGEHGIHLVRALSLADVPRVLIPRAGGCWHQQ